MPFSSFKITLSTLILSACCLSVFYGKGQNVKQLEEKDIWRSLSLPFIDSGKQLHYTTLKQAKQKDNRSFRESRTMADCKTTTFYMHLTGAAGEKIRLYDAQTLVGGDFVSFGSIAVGSGDEEGLIVRMSNTGDIVSKNKFRISGKPAIIHSVKVWASGKIVIAGVVNNSNSIFIAELKDDFTISWSSVFSLASKPSKVKLALYDIDNPNTIGIATQLPSSVVYSSLSTTGQLLWSKETLVKGLTDLVGFSPLSYSRYGLVVNSVNNSKTQVMAFEIASATGSVISSTTLGDGSKEILGLKTTAYAGRLKLLAVSAQSTGKFAVERNIMYSASSIETKHIYSLNEPIDLKITGALDNAGDAMGVCSPQVGKIIFIKHFADYYSTPDNTREYTVPAGADIVSVSRSFDGGYLFGLNTKNDEEIIFIKTDSSGIIAGCNYVNVHNDVLEKINDQNCTFNTSASSLYLSSLPASFALSDASLSTRFDCRQNYCPTAPQEDICLSTYYKTLRSNSYVDAFVNYYLMRNNNQLALTQRFDRILGGGNQVTVGLKLFDEKGNFIKGVNVFLDGVSSSVVCRKMDDKSVMLISYSTRDNIPYYTFTLVSDDLQIVWSKTVKTYQNFEFGSDGFSDMVKDEEGNYYMVASGGGFYPSKPKVQVYKMDALGNQVWLKTYEFSKGYLSISSATTTKSSLIMVCEGSNEGSISIRIDKNTGSLLNSFIYNNTWDGTIYKRLLMFDNNRIYYAGNNGKSDFTMALFDTTGRPYKFRTIKSTGSLRAGTVKNGMLFGYYSYYNGTTNKNVLLKADSNLAVQYSNEYNVMLGGFPRGMDVSDNGSIYIGGNYSYSGYYDPYIMKFNNNGEIGTCSYTPSTPQIDDVDVLPVELAFSPLTRSFQAVDIPVTFVPDNNGQSISGILCSSAPQCDYIKISGNSAICKLNEEYTFKAARNSTCTVLPTWVYDTAVALIKKTTDSTITLMFKKTGNTSLVGRLNTGCTNYDDSLLLHIQQAPTKFSLGNDTTLCPGDSVTINADRNFNSYLWNTGGTGSSITIKSAGKYFVRVDNVCNDSYTDTILVTSAVVPFLSIGNDTTMCAGDTLVRSASSVFASYNWLPQPLRTNNNKAIFLPAQTGSFVLSALTKEGCAAADTIIVTVLSAPPVYLGPDTSFCSTDSMILSVPPNGFSDYKWNTGSAAQSITIRSAGTYSVIAKAADGCYAKDTMVVKRTYSAPVVNLGSDFSLCTGSSRTLHAPTFATYLWQDGSIKDNYNVSKPGSFWVTVVDKNNCVASDTINVLSLLTLPSNFLRPVDSLCEYDKIELKSSANFNSYSWSTGSREPTIVVDKPGTYILYGTNAEGCKGSDTTLVIRKDCQRGVFIPTAFTPNKDGTNDVFRAKVFGNVLSFQLTIYNRFGQAVFSTSDPYKSWDGNLRGVPESTGAFVYKCSYRLDGRNETTERGTLMLIR